MLLGAAEPVGKFAAEDGGPVVWDDGFGGDRVDRMLRRDDPVLDGVAVDAHLAAGVGRAGDVHGTQGTFVDEVEDVLLGAIVKKERGFRRGDPRAEEREQEVELRRAAEVGSRAHGI